MFTQRLIVQVEPNESHPALQVRVALQIVDVRGSIVATKLHRTAVDYENGDVVQQMEAVNEDITAMGWPSLTSDQIGMVKAHYDVQKSLR